MGLQNLTDIHTSRNTKRVQNDVDRSTVLEERHILDGQDLGDNTLVAVTSGELVTIGDLALLRDVDAHKTVHTWWQLITLVAIEDANPDDLARLTMGHLERGVANLAGLLTEDRAEQALLRGQLSLTLGGYLADEDVTSDNIGTDANNSALVQISQNLLGDVRDVPGDLLRSELGIASINLMLLDVDRRQNIVLNQTLRQDDGVLVVVTLPWHERHEQVAAKGHLTLIGTRTIGQNRTGHNPLTLFNDRSLVETGALVGATELLDPVGAVLTVVLGNGDQIGRNLGDDTGALGDDDIARIGGGTVLHTGTDQRRLTAQQRHRLTLHVRAHEGAVCIVMLEERDHRCCDGDHLARRYVHVVNRGAWDVVDLTTLGANEHAWLGELAIVLQRRVCLGDDVQILFVSGDVIDLIGDPAIDNLAVRGLDEAECVDPSEGGQRTDQTDVGAFRRLDRAHTSVVRRVHVTNLKACPLAGQTTWTKSRQTALVGKTRKWVGLVHELRQLARAEELLDGGHDRADVDQGLRRDRLDVLGGHTLANHTLHTGQTCADLVLDQLANRTQTAIAEVIDIVGLQAHERAIGIDELGFIGVQAHQVLDRRHDVVNRDRALR